MLSHFIVVESLARDDLVHVGLMRDAQVVVRMWIMPMQLEVLVEQSKVELVSVGAEGVTVSHRCVPAAWLFYLSNHPGDQRHVVHADVQYFM
jgi:hypothetical protein